MLRGRVQLGRALTGEGGDGERLLRRRGGISIRDKAIAELAILHRFRRRGRKKRAPILRG